MIGLVVVAVLLLLGYFVVMDMIQPTTPSNSQGQEIINKSNQQGNVVGDGVNQRVLVGFQKDGFGDGKDYGIKVAQEGYDVRTATDDELVMSSGFNLFKIVQSGTTSITPPSPWSPGGAGKRRVTIAHNLGYKPANLVYVDNPVVVGVSDSGDGLGLLPNPLFLIGSYYTVIQSHAHVDTTNLYIDLIFLNQAGTNITGANAYTWNYRYYLLQETAN